MLNSTKVAVQGVSTNVYVNKYSSSGNLVDRYFISLVIPLAFMKFSEWVCVTRSHVSMRINTCETNDEIGVAVQTWL